MLRRHFNVMHAEGEMRMADAERRLKPVQDAIVEEAAKRIQDDMSKALATWGTIAEHCSHPAVELCPTEDAAVCTSCGLKLGEELRPFTHADGMRLPIAFAFRNAAAAQRRGQAPR